MVINELIYKTNQVTDTENKVTATKGGKGRGISWEVRIEIHTHIK